MKEIYSYKSLYLKKKKERKKEKYYNNNKLSLKINKIILCYIIILK